MSTTPTPVVNIAGVLLAALATLGFGAVLGPEMPVIALGSATGMAVKRWVRLDERGTAVVSGAGSFAAVSALFGGPLVAGMLLVESGIGLGTALLPALLPGFVAAAIGYVLFIGFGHWSGLNAPGLVVPHLPVYHGTHLDGLVLAIVLGASLPALVNERSTKVLVVLFVAKVLVVLFVAKVLAYAVSMGCGFRGGPIFPAIFVGVAIATFPVVWFHVSPTWAIVVGTAAGMAAQTRLLVSPLLFGALLAGTAGTNAVPAAVIATATAWLVTTALERRDESAAGGTAPEAAN